MMVLLIAFFLCPCLVLAANTWPGDGGVEIGQAGGLPIDYEPSGAVWHTGRQRLLIVSDAGLVTEMDEEGNNQVTWSPGGDLEAITLADGLGNLVYLGLEHPDSVLEFDLDSGLLTGESWDLTPWMTGLSNQGLEALTYVEGLYYAGHQGEGAIYVFRLLDAGQVELVEIIPSTMGRNDLSGLHYHPGSGILYAIRDSYDLIEEMEADGTLLREYTLAGDNQEGVALKECCPFAGSDIFIAEDSSEVWRYGGYPLDCPTISAELSCSPGKGTLPFTTLMTVTLFNQDSEHSRRTAGRIDVTLAAGNFFPTWRVGYTNVAAGDSFVISWSQSIPALGAVIGSNLFELVAEDVTPAPYNQPPYPPAGDTDTAACTVTGVEP